MKHVRRSLCLVPSAWFLCHCSATPPPAPVPVAAPAPAPHQTFHSMDLVRMTLSPGEREPKGYIVYAYLLLQRDAPEDARAAALSTFLCDTPLPVKAGHADRQGVYLVPVTDSQDRPIQRSELEHLITSYDYAGRAHQYLNYLVHLDAIPSLGTTGIYFAVFDRPIPDAPSVHAVYEISRLRTPSAIRQWLLLERESLELGKEAPFAGIRSVPPTGQVMLEGLGTATVNILSVFGLISKPAAAKPLACQ